MEKGRYVKTGKFDFGRFSDDADARRLVDPLPAEDAERPDVPARHVDARQPRPHRRWQPAEA